MNHPKSPLFILSALVYLAFLSCNQTSVTELPVYNPSDFNPDLVDISLRNKNEDHKVSDFELINQNGELVTQKDYEGYIYVVDFFFTKCLSICPVMTNNMAKLQNEFLTNDRIKFLSVSVTPNIDSIPVLRKYATEKGVIDSKWNITTGSKKHIYELARKSYFAVVTQGDGGLQDFIHTPNFILVDRSKQIRGIYDGTNDADIQHIISDIKVLMN